jgi:hypothetical protein
MFNIFASSRKIILAGLDFGSWCNFFCFKVRLYRAFSLGRELVIFSILLSK